MWSVKIAEGNATIEKKASVNNVAKVLKTV